MLLSRSKMRGSRNAKWAAARVSLDTKKSLSVAIEKSEYVPIRSEPFGGGVAYAQDGTLPDHARGVPPLPLNGEKLQMARG